MASNRNESTTAKSTSPVLTLIASSSVVILAAPALTGLAWGDSGGSVSTLPVRDTVSTAAAQEPLPNSLTPEEVAEGWQLLFDGSLAGWRGYRRSDVPSGWSVQDGALAFSPGAGSGDLITEAIFANFELVLEWKISPGGNSGIFYRTTEAEAAPYWTAPEMQILDNAGHADGSVANTSAGSNYGLHAPSQDVTKPAGEWNQVRIAVWGPHVEHWMNGVKVVEYELWSEQWRKLVAATKFGEWPGYGMAREGHIGLQDHGDPVWFRNIKIRVSLEEK